MVQVVTPDACRRDNDETLNMLIGLTVKSAKWTEKDARYLVDKVEELRRLATWPRRLDGEPKTWDRFCRQVLGYEAGYLNKISEGIAILETKGVQEPTIGQALDVMDRARTATPLPAHGEIGNGRSRDSNTTSTGNRDADYLTARIARDRPDILDRMKAGEFPSVRKAALEAGIVRPTVQVPIEPQAAARRLARHFTGDALDALIAALEALRGH